MVNSEPGIGRTGPSRPSAESGSTRTNSTPVARPSLGPTVLATACHSKRPRRPGPGHTRTGRRAWRPASAIGDRHAVGPQAVGGGGHVDRGVSAADDEDAATDLALLEGASGYRKMKSRASRTPGEVFPLDPERSRPPHADARGTRHRDSARRPGRSRGSTRWLRRTSIPTNPEQVRDLGQGDRRPEILYGGDPQASRARRGAPRPRRRRPRGRVGAAHGRSSARRDPTRSRPRVRPLRGPAVEEPRPRSGRAGRSRKPLEAANRDRRPCTSVWSTQAPSQRTSVGQARAQLPPKMLAPRIVRAPTRSGCISDLADEPRDVDPRRARRVQGASKQNRHRDAPSSASPGGQRRRSKVGRQLFRTQPTRQPEPSRSRSRTWMRR